ncbi:EamA family transporter [Neisseria wadsworthii]|uniref:Drug/metabolite transporter family membrane protein n=1 Tax=Neisseria wadsworthii 9715 TaxID=1030841 RepID=G4CNK5_9NEIS|nr:EamA family transporter [Neisseria wadsworthii]EGZ49353.1 drug/metabolite transporter family membrane protein [Neisseria wadsworthii 9715]QMT36622.1 EamA family transporter [Neisseria wadsworthii]
MSTRFPIILLTALAPLIWGSTYLVTTEFLPPDRPFTAALLRTLPAGLLLLLWKREWPQKHEIGKVFLLAVFNIGFFQAMLFVSAYRLPGGLAAILTSTQTLMVLLLVWVWLVGKSKPPKTAWFSALLGVMGIVLLVYSPQIRFDPIGIASALLGAASMAVGIFFSKHWRFGLSILAFSGWQLLLGGLCLLPVALWLEPPLPALSATNIGGYVYLSLLGTVLAYVLFFQGLNKLPSAVVSALGLLSPIAAFLLGWLFLGQSLNVQSMIGLTLALFSIFGVQRALQNSKESA